MKTNLTIAEMSSGERPNQQSEKSDGAAVRKLDQPAISSVMKETLNNTERNESEPMDQQSKETSKSAVRKINPVAISPVMNTTNTILGECCCTTESDALPDINQRQQPHAGRSEDSIMNNNTSAVNNEGAASNRSRFGVGVTNMIELKDSTPECRKFRFKLKAKGFSFWSEAESAGDQGWTVKWPWPKSVRIEASGEKEGIEEQVLEKLKEAFSEFDLAMAA